MKATLSIDVDAPVVRARVPLEDSRTEAGLGVALRELARIAKDVEKLVASRKKEPPPFLRVTFHTPRRQWLSERRFFERTARHPSLAKDTLGYVALVNPKKWKRDPFHGGGFWTSILAPAGSLAIVPLALRDRAFLGPLGEHLRGADLDHETFHRALVAEIVARHGWCDEVLDLIAVRAVDAAGQHGPEDLRCFAAQPAFAALLSAPDGVRSFASRVERVSRRKSYRALYVASAGQSLFAEDPKRYAEWIAFFAKLGLEFDATESAPPEPRAPYPSRPFASEWEKAASCDDVDA